MLWLKAFHIVFVVTWFAGLFYLPRLFVYHAAEPSGPVAERLAVMERRLFVIMSIGGVLAIAFGVAILIDMPVFVRFGWLHAKLALVGLLVLYHLACRRLMRQLCTGRSTHSTGFLRAFNEVPGVLLIGIVLLVVLKPF